MERFFTIELQAKDYMARFRDPVRIEGYCRECANYGKSWACPPFDRDISKLLSQWDRALIIAVKVNVPANGTPISQAMEILRPVRTGFERSLLKLEGETDGLALGFAGKCLHCDSCLRTTGKECAFPHLVRPSLEAYGFDVVRTTSELLGLEMEWSHDGTLPRVLMLVGALFHNRPPGAIHFPC